MNIIRGAFQKNQSDTTSNSNSKNSQLDRELSAEQQINTDQNIVSKENGISNQIIYHRRKEFKFEWDDETANAAESIIKNALQLEEQKAVLPIELAILFLNSIKTQKDLLNNIIESQSQINKFQFQQKEYIQRIQTLEKSLKQKQNDTNTKIQQILNDSNKKIQLLLDKEKLKEFQLSNISQDKQDLQQLNASNNRTIKELELKLEEKDSDILNLKIKIKEIENELQKLTNLRDIRLDQVIKRRNNSLGDTNNIQKDDFINQKSEKSQFSTIVNEAAIWKHVISFLNPNDILKMRLLNIETFVHITYEPFVFPIIYRNFTQIQQNEIKELRINLSFFSDSIKQIKDDFLRNIVMKYLCQKQHVCDFMLSPFSIAKNLLDGTPVKPQSNNKEKMENSQIENQDLLGLHTNDTDNNLINKGEPENNQSNTSKIAPKQEQKIDTNKNNNVNNNGGSGSSSNSSSSSIFKNTFKKLIDFGSSSTSNGTKKNPEINQVESVLIPAKNLNDGVNDFLKNIDPRLYINMQMTSRFAKDRENSIKQLFKETQFVGNRINHLITQIGNDKNQVIPFFEKLEQAFSMLFVFSQMMYQQCQEMYTLQHFLITKMQEKQFENRKIKFSFEDLNASINSEKQAQVFFAEQLRDIEIQLDQTLTDKQKLETQLAENQTQIEQTNSLNKQLQTDQVELENALLRFSADQQKITAQNEELSKINHFNIAQLEEFKQIITEMVSQQLPVASSSVENS